MRWTSHFITSRYVLILPANYLEKYFGKSKEQNAGKISGKLEKWALRNGSNLAHLYEILDTLIEQSCIVLGQNLLIGMATKDRDTLIEQ